MATWLHKSLYLFGTVQVRNKMKSVGPFAVAELETGTLAKRWLVEMFRRVAHFCVSIGSQNSPDYRSQAWPGKVCQRVSSR